MPVLDFGQKAPFEGKSSKIFKLKTKGEKVTIRILGRPHYTGKHFIRKNNGDWLIFFCPRIMKGSKCMYCDKYFELMKLVKEAKEKGDKKAVKALRDEARQYGPTVRFYYPALIREREEAVLLEVPLSVRLKIDDYVDAGVDVLSSDFIYRRTEKPGSDFYSLIRLDSKDVKPLTDKEKKEAESVKDWDIEGMLGVSKESSQELGASDDELYQMAEEIFGEKAEGKPVEADKG